MSDNDNMHLLVPGTTLEDARRIVLAQLAAAGIDEPHVDARWLVAAAAGLSQEQLMLDAKTALSAAAAETLARFLTRRLRHEPVSRILGRRDFWGRTFEVTPATLDPRPDTETLIMLALEITGRRQDCERGLRILDIGTGTGAIVLTLVAEIEGASGLGVDISDEALEVARRNAQRLDLAGRVDFQRADVLEGVVGSFDLIVSNPPYIATGEIAGLAPDVRDFDPRAALDGGVDGLDFYRRIISTVPRVAAEEAWCVLEIGAGQAQDVVRLIRATSAQGQGGVAGIEVRQDLGGNTRCVAYKPRPSSNVR